MEKVGRDSEESANTYRAYRMELLLELREQSGREGQGGRQGGGSAREGEINRVRDGDGDGDGGEEAVGVRYPCVIHKSRGVFFSLPPAHADMAPHDRRLKFRLPASPS